MKDYNIKAGYAINEHVTQPQYSVEESLIYQAAVYEYAALLIPKYQIKSVLDVGCGLGSKLERKLLPLGVQITGVDSAETIERCKTQNRFGRWISDDIENPSRKINQDYDLVMAVDVIEHLYDPDLLFDYIRRAARYDSHVLLSTPERDLRRGTQHCGPPGNGAHVREWNREEFALYVQSAGLRILNHEIVEMCPNMPCCQLVHGQPQS